MSVDFTKAFRVRALSLSDKSGIFASDSDPTTIDTSSFPVSSLCLQTAGKSWVRTGSGSSDWLELGVGETGAGVPVGGSTGQLLAKIDGVDHNTQWVDPSGGIASISDSSEFMFLIGGA